MNRIEVYKGNSLSLKVKLEKDNTVKPFINGDRIIFTLFKNNKRDKNILLKEITSFDNGIALINLKPKETELDHGVYHYNVRFIDNSNNVFDIVNGIFQIIGGVPYEQ